LPVDYSDMLSGDGRSIGWCQSATADLHPGIGQAVVMSRHVGSRLISIKWPLRQIALLSLLTCLVGKWQLSIGWIPLWMYHWRSRPPSSPEQR